MCTKETLGPFGEHVEYRVAHGGGICSSFWNAHSQFEMQQLFLLVDPRITME